MNMKDARALTLRQRMISQEVSGRLLTILAKLCLTKPCVAAILIVASYMSMSQMTVNAGDALVGRYSVNYRDNAAGRYTDQSRPDYTQANPYYGNVIPPGPVFINAAPGQYRLVVEAGGGCGVWSGDATRGSFLFTGHNPGEAVTLEHGFGQIALYYWDWYAHDNDAGVGTTIAVYRIGGTPGDAHEPDEIVTDVSTETQTTSRR